MPKAPGRTEDPAGVGLAGSGAGGSDGRTAGGQLAEPLADGEIRVTDVRISVPVKDRTQALVTIANSLHEARIEPEDITLRRPTLDEVFLHLTGPEVAA